MRKVSCLNTPIIWMPGYGIIGCIPASCYLGFTEMKFISILSCLLVILQSRGSNASQRLRLINFAISPELIEDSCRFLKEIHSIMIEFFFLPMGFQNQIADPTAWMRVPRIDGNRYQSIFEQIPADIYWTKN
jgi:hypothetical protein